jgi:hypothetical protein
MQKSIEDIKIIAYLTPDPLDDFSGLEGDFLTWIPGFVNEPDEDGLPAIYRDCNILHYQNLEALIEKYFKKSIHNYWPLLSKVHLNVITILIDISGALSSSEKAYAGYLPESSSQIEGNYTFRADMNLIQTYLHIETENLELSPFSNTIWEHELTHLLDHENIKAGSLYLISNSPRENFKSFILNFRQEGIASFYYFLKGNSEIENLNEAITKFKKIVNERKDTINFSTPTNEDIKNKLYDCYEFYSLGPWIMLDILRDYWHVIHAELINDCIDKLEKREKIEEENILKIIKISLGVSSAIYLELIEKYFEDGFILLI